MARPLLLLLTTLALAAPAGASAAQTPVTAPACHRTTATPRVVATRTVTASGRAAIVACDRASGHRKVLRHGYAGSPPKASPALSAPAVQGTRVVWSELLGRARHLRQDLRSADVRHPTRQTRRRIGPTKLGNTLGVDSEAMQVLALPGGALAYISYGGPFGGTPTTLVLQRRGRAPQTLSTTNQRLATVEDGRTLVWLDDRGYHAVDLAPVPRDASGCPIRSAYHGALDTPQLRVSSAVDSDFILDAETAVRICWKATGRDDIATTLGSETYLTQPLVAAGRYVALTAEDIDRYQACYDTPESGIYWVSVVDALRAGTTAAHLSGACVVLQSLVLSPAGVPAWLVTDNRGARVEVPGAKGNTVLDAGPAGTLAGLAAQPDGGFTWTHDGVLRGWTATA